MIKLDRKRNAVKGTITGIIVQMFNMLMPFMIRTLFIYFFGIEYIGLNSLFASILQVLNLAELGVGSALVFSMYEPISKGDISKICALMRLYQIYYRVIGFVVLGVGLLLIPVLDNLILGDVPVGINIYVVYLLQLFATTASYWLYAYRNSIIIAYQKNYVVNLITFFVNLSKYVVQFLVLIFLKNYYMYLIIIIVSQIAQNIITMFAAKRMFPQYHPAGSIECIERKEINKKVFNLFAAKVCGVVTNSADSMVISAFLGLSILGVYNNYYYILTSVMAMIAVIYNSFRAGLGNALITESKENIISEFNRLTCMVSLIISVCFSCFLTLYQPFILLWVGKDNLLDFSSVLLLCIYFLSYEYPIFWAMYKDAAGKWKEDRTRSIVAPMFNLGLNILLVKTIGLNGVIISTIVTYGVISGPWLLMIIKKYVIDFNIKQYFSKLAMYIVCIIISAIVSYIICKLIHGSGISTIILNLVVSVMTSCGIFTAFFFKTKEYKSIYGFFINNLKAKIWRING